MRELGSEGLMIHRRGVVCFGLAALAAAWLFLPPEASADPAFKRLLPLLIDLDGWTGKKPDGMSMDMANASMTTATREYQRGGAQLHAAVVIGPAAAGALGATLSGMSVETSDGHILTATINGLKATKTYNSTQKSGAIMVALGETALFSVSYNGLTEDEALPLAQKFDWKAIQAAVGQK
jgi:hypothetical protein